jgi:hypothetical protein
MRSWKHLIALPAAGALVAGLLVAGASPAAWSAPAAPTASPGKGAAVARSVNLTTAAKGPQIAPKARSFGPLARDGQPTGTSLSAKSTVSTKPRTAATKTSGPNVRTTASGSSTVQPLIAPGTTNANFAGITQAGSNCNGCQPPDPNAAVSPSQIAHAVNLRLQVFSKTGTTLCGIGLNSLLGFSGQISDPRIQWDNLNNRFTMAVIPVPTSTTSTPRMFLLASKTSSACGSWWIYNLSFSGSLYPAGTLLDYPYLGQDRRALLLSSNNFRRTATGGFSYINSAVFSINKAAVYAGAGVSFPAFAVGFSTAPVTVTGIPIAATTYAYYLRSIPGTGYQLYRMANSGIAGTTLTAQAVASSAFVAPPRRVRQPGTTDTLDPHDGRSQNTPFQDEGFVWFSHGQGVSGYPAVRYGAINTSTNAVTAQNAFRSSTSDDFNPSIGVADAGAGVVYAWLNWAYTDTPNGRATSHTVDGVAPGSGVPALIGTGRVLINGFTTTTNTRFGDYSSISVDPTAASATCPAGRTAVLAQQVFQSNSQWITRIARVSFC